VRLEDFMEPPPQVAALLYRAAQEAVRNAARHSGARRVDLCVSGLEKRWELVVEDDGRGMPAGRIEARHEEGHLGLHALGELLADAAGRWCCTRRRTPDPCRGQGACVRDQGVGRRRSTRWSAVGWLPDRHRADLELVGTASDGAEAVQLAVDSGADVVVMDLSMPELDGVAATRSWRPRCRPCRVLVLTSFFDPGRVTDALRAGADGYLLKHAEPEDILDGIRKWSAADPRSTRSSPESWSTSAAPARSRGTGHRA
jgi:CheY-like chemotaxis protein